MWAFLAVFLKNYLKFVEQIKKTRLTHFPVKFIKTSRYEMFSVKRTKMFLPLTVNGNRCRKYCFFLSWKNKKLRNASSYALARNSHELLPLIHMYSKKIRGEKKTKEWIAKSIQFNHIFFMQFLNKIWIELLYQFPDKFPCNYPSSSRAVGYPHHAEYKNRIYFFQRVVHNTIARSLKN